MPRKENPNGLEALLFFSNLLTLNPYSNIFFHFILVMIILFSRFVVS